MRARVAIADTAVIAAQIEAASGTRRLRDTEGSLAAATPDLTEVILAAAAT